MSTGRVIGDTSAQKAHIVQTSGNTLAAVPGSGLPGGHWKVDMKFVCEVRNDSRGSCSVYVYWTDGRIGVNRWTNNDKGNWTQHVFVSKTYEELNVALSTATRDKLSNDGREICAASVTMYDWDVGPSGNRAYMYIDAPGKVEASKAYVGQLTDFTWKKDSNNKVYATLYVSSMTEYSSGITSAVTMYPYAIQIYGLWELLDYFPWAIRKGSNWKSCNRDGGHLQSRKGNAYKDRKNTPAED